MAETDLYDPAKCCNCGSQKYSLIASGPIVPIIACAKCGLMRQGFLQTSVTKGYSFTTYAGGGDRFLKQRKDKEVAQVADYLKAAYQLEKFMPVRKVYAQKGRLLEIGCAMGTTLNEFRKRGWNVCGVEPEESTCNLAREKYGLDIINSTFQEAGIKDGAFDVVLLFHVIEHLPDPATSLCLIAEFIRPGGYLVLETPRFDSLMFKILRGRERSVIPGHLHYFTQATIQALACKAGFEVVKLESVGRTVTLDRLCFYLAKFLNSHYATKALTFFSVTLFLNKVRLYINLRDMMRLYLRKVD